MTWAILFAWQKGGCASLVGETAEEVRSKAAGVRARELVFATLPFEVPVEGNVPDVSLPPDVEAEVGHLFRGGE
jgi:hypothetical protein